MPTRRLTLLRHGEPLGGQRCRGSTDDPLSAKGLQQMQAALPDRCWNNIISSPLQRCETFAKTLGQTYQCDPDWREIHFGDWEGQTWQQIQDTDAAALAAYWQNPDGYTPPNAEPFGVFRARIQQALQHWASSGQDTLVITHGGNIRMLLCLVLNLPATQFASLHVPYACVSQIVYDGIQLQLLTHNCAAV